MVVILKTEKYMNSKVMLHIKPTGFADELNGGEQQGKVCGVTPR